MSFAVKRDRVECEQHTVAGVPVIVYRADDVVADHCAPYVKCAVLPAFCNWAKLSGIHVLGYYASRESFWVGDLKRECDARGMIAFITHPRTKEPPAWAQAIGDSLHLLRPNVYSVNFNISRRMIGEGGLMLPMGIDVKAFVELQTAFFKRFTLPVARSYVVPSGSGTAASCVARALTHDCAIYAIATRPARSVQRVIDYNTFLDARVKIVEHHEQSGDEAQWPVSKGWERTAYSWLEQNAQRLEQPICFLNLGR